MTDDKMERTPRHTTTQEQSDHGHRAHGHGWMMILCCIPMLAVALLLVATGVVGVSFLVIAVACTVMMAMMMRGMAGGANGPDRGTR